LYSGTALGNVSFLEIIVFIVIVTISISNKLIVNLILQLYFYLYGLYQYELGLVLNNQLDC